MTPCFRSRAVRRSRGRAVVSAFLFSLIAGLVGAELVIRAFDLFATERGLTRVAPDERGRPGAASPWALVHPYQGFSMRPGEHFEVAYLDYLERALPEGEQVRRKDHSRNVFGFRSSIRDYR